MQQTMHPEITPLGSYYLRGYLQGAIQQGYDPEAILRQADISPSAYTNPAATLDGPQMQRLIVTLRETMNDHYMGFLQVPGKLAMDAEAARGSVRAKTLGEGIRNLIGFINAVRSDEVRECVVDDESGEVSMVCRFSGFNPGVDPHLLYWFRLYWGYRFYCWLIGNKIILTRVCFSSPEPPEAIDYRAVFDCPVTFDEPEDKYCFDQDFLLAPVIRNEVELFSGDFPLKYPNWFTLPGGDQTLTSQVEQLLLELNRQGMPSPSIEVIAGIANMSPRTLSRRLSKENASFHILKNKVRCDIAKKLLSNHEIPINHIAVEIGFAEPGDFTRAFTRWTGLTPSNYRARHDQTDHVRY